MPSGPDPPLQPTRMESWEEIERARAAQQPAATRKEAAPQPLGRKEKVPFALPASAAPRDDALLFRPTQRPPMALLCVLDDGSGDEGEWLRLRGDQYVIGRAEGDVVIPHDGRMSRRHAQLARQPVGDAHRWFLTDLGSTHGTLVQVNDAALKAGREFVVGGTKLRFDLPRAEDVAALSAPSGGATQGWQGPSLLAVLPSVVFVNPDGSDGRAVPLTGAEAWIGRDRGCTVPVPDDPFLGQKHARLYKDAGGQWHLKDNDSTNGVWVRIDQPLPIKKGVCHFLLGEQRFLLRVLS